MKLSLTFAICATLALAASANVVDLSDENFGSTIKENDVSFVKFFAPWCGHCKRLAPAWQKVADAVEAEENVVIGEVDCTKHRDLCAAHQVRGYPTLKLFKKDDFKGTKYSGARDAPTLETYVRDQLDMAKQEL